MGKGWENELKKKMKDFQVKPGPAVWSNVEKRNFPPTESSVIPLHSFRKSRGKRSFFVVVGSIAAIFLLFIGLRNNFESQDLEIEREEQETLVVEGPKESLKEGSILQSLKEESDQWKSNHIEEVSELPIADTEETPSFREAIVVESKLLKDESSVSEEQSKLGGIEEDQVESDFDEVLQNIVEEELAELLNFENELERNEKMHKTRKDRESRWLASLVVSDFLTKDTEELSGYRTAAGNNLLTVVEGSGKGVYSNVLDDILVLNRNKQVSTKVKHKAPLTYGISFSFALRPRLSVGSGVTYTKLSAETTSGSIKNKVVSDQEIHYVGVPVQLNYKVIANNSLSVYGTGGFLVEKAVSSREYVKYYLENQVMDYKSQSIKVDRLHTSVYIGLGIDKKITSSLSVFAEPVLRYHFNEGGAVQTIYKEKPVSFNLKLGVKIALSK